MIDAFVKLHGTRPMSSSQTLNRDIDFVYTFGIDTKAISTLELNFPVRAKALFL
jgi:hypothetical protein